MHGYTVAPIILAEQARVAIGDEIGSLLQARLTIMLIGERPDLSAADSIGAYICSGGLPPVAAVEKVANLVNVAFPLQLTGIKLKDELPLLPEP